MVALLLFIPTLYGMPQALFLLAIPAILTRKREWELRSKDGSLFSLVILLGIAALSALNNMIGIGRASGLSDALPFTVLHLVTFFVALNLDDDDLEIIIKLVGAEAVIVLIQFILGVNTFFVSHPDFKKFDDITYIYFIRPMGLSSSSSTVAFKLLCGIALLTARGFRRKHDFPILILMLAALGVNFNRTAIIAVGASLGLLFMVADRRPKIVALKIIFAATAMAVAWKLGLGRIVIDQFSRGRGTIDLSYRDVLWTQSFAHIAENPIFGNGSYKYMTPLYVYNASMEHAHNSFIEMLATHGIPIFSLYILFISKNIRGVNALALLPFIFLSMYQYGIFWGISFADVIFFRILMLPKRIEAADENTLPGR